MRTLLLILSCLSFSALANIEITPFAGYRIGGDFESIANNTSSEISLAESSSYGLITAWPYDNKRQGELLLSHYKTSLLNHNEDKLSYGDISISYLHLGGNIPIAHGKLPLWISGGMGVTLLSPEKSNLRNETKFSVNLGINTLFQLSENLALKAGGRIYATFFNSAGEILCGSNECNIRISSEIWLQSEFYTGLTVRF